MFGPRVIEAIAGGVEGPTPTGAMRAVLGIPAHSADSVIGGRSMTVPRLPVATPVSGDLDALRERLQRAMTTGAGVLRSATSLAETEVVVAGVAVALDAQLPGPAREELRNLVTVGHAILAMALARAESRGAHTRTDFPHTDPHMRVRFVVVGVPEAPDLLP